MTTQWGSHPDIEAPWPVHVGVGGISVRRARSKLWEHAPTRVLALLSGWADALDAHPDRSLPAGGFPFQDVVDHYQTRGRNYAMPQLVTRLRELHGLLPLRPPAGDGMLVDWLPSTFDQDYGNFDSYLAIPMLECVAAANGAEAGIDAELVALLADLLMTEAGALAVNPDSPTQRTRTHAALQALARVREFAPRVPLPDVVSTAALRPAGRDVPGLVDVALRCAQAALAVVPMPARHAVEIAMLPTTPMHDELMFIRCTQMFELVYRQMYRCLERALAALDTGDVIAATAELADATGRLEGSPPLYRILTTMSRESFAVIRNHTNGRSAIQSRAYRQVERICAPRPAGPADDRLPKVEVPSPTLQEVYEARAAASRDSALSGTVEAMARLDRSWRAMKRTHWGITLKIIGNVPGTGGTSGAAYLKAAAEIPLFPFLHGGGVPGDDGAKGGRDA